MRFGEELTGMIRLCLLDAEKKDLKKSEFDSKI